MVVNVYSGYTEGYERPDVGRPNELNYLELRSDSSTVSCKVQQGLLIPVETL